MIKRSFMFAAGAVAALGLLFACVADVSATTLEYQTLIQANAALQHHYTFDGASDPIRLEDKEGVADMNQSPDANLPALGAAGFDGTSSAADFDGSGLMRLATGATAVTLDATSFTSEVVVRFDAVGTAGQYVFTGNEGGGGDRTLMALHDFLGADALAAVGGGVFGPGAEYIGGGSMVAGNWYFLAATFTSTGDIQTYAADLTAGTPMVTGTPITDPDGGYNTSATDLWVGGPWFSDTLFPLDGATDELAIFNGELNATTIQAHLTALTGAPPAVIGDFDGDGNVTTLDFDIMKTNWLTTGNAFNTNGEVTNDGLVSLADFSEFKENLFPGGAEAFATASASAVPEPGSLLLVLAMAPAWLGMRRPRRRMACRS